MLEIRREIEADYPEVFQINLLAFGGDAEPRLVEKLRAKPHTSLVAVDGGKVVGQIFFSGIFIEDPENLKPDTIGLRTDVGPA